MTFDVVTVPDFLSDPEVFELRSLLFLGSWQRNAGSDHQLHLACIGEPPARVRALAEQCDARVSVHEPVMAEQRGFSNKLRGLELEAVTGSILLVDTDIFFFHGLSDLGEVGSSLAACAATSRGLPKRYWKRIYEAKGLSLPAERMASVFGELIDQESAKGLTESERRRLVEFVPYFNSGVVLTSQPMRLRRVWEENIRFVASLFDLADSNWRWLGASDQAGFAVTVQELRKDGFSFEPLPAAANTRWPQVATGALTWEQTMLYHASGLFRPFPGWSRMQLFEALREYSLTIENNPLLQGGSRYAGIRPDPDATELFLSKFVPEVHSIIKDYVLA